VNAKIHRFFDSSTRAWKWQPVCPEKVTRAPSSSADKLTRKSRSRCRGVPVLVDCGDLGVNYLQEFATKSRGRWAGASQVRHRRCGFKQFAQVCTGSSFVHRLTTHIVRKVRTGVQRPAAQQKWPSKRTLTLERALDRALKFDVPPHHEAM
jgi:hypothetical protein